jgi:tRNA A-37 threonylcarbamoyl transferase component Bud32/TolB-like protein
MPDIIEQLRASISDRYSIERELGRGGMATVYLATDVRHDRKVAIKVLHPDLSATIGAERFEREIKLAAKLQHPHILGLFDSGEADGLLFFVMPFVDGESVRDRLDREKQLPIEDAINIAIEVADALGYAHAQGIIHRDIKPENVMLSNGHALVADFGIARARTEAGQNRLTQTGMAMGTPVYMSPEQFTGEPVTPAADIYSLGCMLYEMLAGDPPFSGKNATAIMAKHAMEAVPSIRIVRPSAPEEVEEAILAAMEKSPADRPRTAAAFCEILGTPMGTTTTRRVSMRMTATRRLPSGAHAMRAVAVPWWRKPAVIGGALVALAVVAGGAYVAARGRGPAASEDPLDRKVAVRYFTVVGGDSAQLVPAAERLTESLINQLSTSRRLSVISANGVAQYRNAELGPDSIATLLRVGTVVQGMIEPDGKDKVRITVHLYDRSGANLGSPKTIKVGKDELFKAEEKVAQEVLSVLRSALGPTIELQEAQSKTKNLNAWTLFNRAERARKDVAVLTSTGADSATAIARLGTADSLFRAARTADSKWVEPALQRVQVALDHRRFVKDDSTAVALLDTANARVEEAFLVDANSARALELRGTVDYEKWKAGRRVLDAQTRAPLLNDAEDALLKAIEKDDRLVTPYATLSALYYDKKDVSNSLLKAQTAYQKDEFLTNSAAILSRLFFGSYDTRAFADAKKWCAEGFRRFPLNFNFTMCQLWLQLPGDVVPDPKVAWQLAGRVDSLAPAVTRAYQSLKARMIVGGIIGRYARTLPSGAQQTAMLDSARRVLERSQGDRSVDPAQELAGYRAVMLAQMGDIDQSIALLTSYVAANPDHTFRVGGNVHWWYDGLVNQRAFKPLLERTK